MTREELFGPVAIRATSDGAKAPGQSVYALTKFLVSMRDPQARVGFAADEESAMLAANLTETDCDLIRRRDYAGLIESGVSIYALGKAAGALGTTLLEIGACGRNMTAQQFTEMMRRERRGS